MVQLPRKAWEAGGLQERSEESKDRTEMKVKDLIKALQERDPELEVMFEEDDSGWGGSREVKGAWDCQGVTFTTSRQKISPKWLWKFTYKKKQAPSHQNEGASR